MIQPTNPQVVYVPQYNPTVVYGTPYVAPGYSTADLATTGLLSFGVGIAIGAAINKQLLRMGLQLLELQLARWLRLLRWHRLLREQRVARRLLRVYRTLMVRTVLRRLAAATIRQRGLTREAEPSRPPTAAEAPAKPTIRLPGLTPVVHRHQALMEAQRPVRRTTRIPVPPPVVRPHQGPNGSAAAGQAYNPNTGAYAATHQTSNAYGNYGSSVASKNGNTAYTQHQTTSQGSVGTVQTSAGGRGAAATGANGNSAAAGQTANGNRYAAGQTANGNKYATQNGNVYKDTGSGWQQTQPQKSTSSYSGANSAAARGYGGQERSSGSSAFGGGGSGWQSREDSARGSSEPRRWRRRGRSQIEPTVRGSKPGLRARVDTC